MKKKTTQTRTESLRRGATMSRSRRPVSLAERPFSAVFQQPRDSSPDTWRIRNSGVMGMPQDSKETVAVLAACHSLGIVVKQTNTGSPVNANSYRLEAQFLDGGLNGETGNYWFGKRGVWVSGSKAVLVLAFQLGLRVTRRWLVAHKLTGVTPSDLRVELAPI